MANSTRTLGFFWNVLRRYGPADCLAAAGRKWAFHRLNRGLPPDHLALRPGVTVRVVREAVPAFRYFTDLDPEMWREMDGFLALTRGRARLLDVGAHYGVFSLAFAANGGEAVVAVEPFPKAFAVLARHAELNPAAAIRAEPVALGDRPGRVWMRADEFHLAATPDETEARAGGLEVPVTTVDALITDLGFRPDTLKIDVEGYEVHVLEGARGLLRETGPLIFLEVHPDHIRQLGRSVEELVKLMAGSGYEFFDARGRSITDVPRHLAGGIRRVVCRKATGG